MRKSSLRCVVTFHTTAGAMAAERLCRREGLEGRLISVPRSLTSDCGLAWCAGLDDKEAVRKVMDDIGVQEQDMHEVMV